MVKFVAMKAGSHLTQETKLKMRMSPQQVRFVRMLEMSETEFEDEVRRELEENPALEIADSGEEGQEGVRESANENDFRETSEQLQIADYGNDDDIPPYLLSRHYDSNDTSRGNVFEQNTDRPSLIESLNEQLDFVDASPRDIALARYLVGYIDSNGRMSRSLWEIAQDLTLSTGKTLSREDLLPAMDIIRYQLEPPGIGAVDLRDCLLIQLRRRTPKTLAVRTAETIIADYFDVFTKKHFDRLQNLLAVDRDTFEEAIELIKSLDPKPGSSLSDTTDSRYSHITPDFIVTPDDEHPGRYSVALANRMPHLVVEQSFMADSRNKAEQLFIRQKRDDAKGFIGLMKRRDQTLLAVMKAIVQIQHRFFETEDSSDLRPMILDDISSLTGLDRSVISRATSNKYVSAPGGTYPLKMFFNDKPTTDSDVSSSEISSILKDIIDGEDKKKPLSDEQLTAMLERRGYCLARRTVTKYREKMNIPVARLRKEF